MNEDNFKEDINFINESDSFPGAKLSVLAPYYDVYPIYDYGIKRCRPGFNTILARESPVVFCKREYEDERLVEDHLAEQKDLVNKLDVGLYKKIPDIYSYSTEQDYYGKMFNNGVDIYHMNNSEKDLLEREGLYNRTKVYDGTGYEVYKQEQRVNFKNVTDDGSRKYIVPGSIYNFKQ